MKRILAMTMIAFAAAASAAHAVTIDPIPGSLTYPTAPEPKPPGARLDGQPTGSILHHEFHRDGYDYRETYVVEPNHDATITRRAQSRPGGFNKKAMSSTSRP